MSVQVQFVWSDTEYATVKEWSDHEGMSISKCVKNQVFQKNEGVNSLALLYVGNNPADWPIIFGNTDHLDII